MRTLVLVGGMCAFASGAFAQDTAPPIVTVTSVRAGDIVPTGLILRADASDDVAVTRVRFIVNGERIGNDVLAAPYWVAWDTALTAEGSHTVTAVAEDAAGNAGSASVTVTVDRTPPLVSFATVTPGATLSGALTIGATAVDNVAVERLSFSVNGVPLGEVLSPPWEIGWDTTRVVDGPRTLRVAARDRAGGLNSVEAAVTIRNDTTHIDQTDAAIAYTGAWLHGNGARSWNGGTAAIAVLTLLTARATLTFEGTGVSWIGFRGPQAGVARVCLDGGHAATVDLFHPTEQVNAVVYRVNGLAAGPHTLAIEATGTWNPLSSDPFVVIDGFIIFR